jgi:hypothetical protein
MMHECGKSAGCAANNQTQDLRAEFAERLQQNSIRLNKVARILMRTTVALRQSKSTPRISANSFSVSGNGYADF